MSPRWMGIRLTLMSAGMSPQFLRDKDYEHFSAIINFVVIQSKLCRRHEVLKCKLQNFTHTLNSLLIILKD